MNILIVVDKHGSAIWRLADLIRVHNPHFDIKVFPVHPKRNDPETLFQAQKLLNWADLVDIHYWKSGEVLRQSFPVEFEKKKKIVCHFNPYDLDKMNWLSIYDDIVVGNQYMHQQVPYAKLIPYMIDLEKFVFNPDMPKEKIVNMVVGRIESKKGVLEVAKACKNLGYTFQLVGKISDLNYMHEVIQAGGSNIHFFENVNDDELVKLYHTSAIHVCNSVDGFESGTLPILEAMACGVPVLTRNVGHVPDISTGGNMLVRVGKKEDQEDLEKNLKELMENEHLRKAMRERAFKTVKTKNAKKMARMFSNLYHRVIDKRFPLVSIIIPTYDRGEPLLDCLVWAVNQDYPHYELVVADSGSFSTEGVIRKLRNETKIPIKYVRFESPGYTLAEARNRAIIESEGEYLVFCDDRLRMDKGAVTAFIKQAKPQCWLWGIKDDAQKPFVENFSCVRREDLVKAGMFLERIDRYGAMSEEIRTRFTRQGNVFELCQEAKSWSTTRSGGREKKRRDMIESKLLLYKLYG